jgi:general secretion pathway protein D
MTRLGGRDAWTFLTAVTLAVCAALSSGAAAASAPPATPAAVAPPASPDDAGPVPYDREVRTTILPGTPAPPPPTSRTTVPPGGDVTLNYPSVDVQAVAKAVLGDILNVKYSIDPQVHGVVTVQTTHPIRRADVLPLFEDALKSGNLALTVRGGVYTIVPLGMASGAAGVVGPADTGFGTETVTLNYASAEELKKLLDPIVPGAISQADTARNVLIVVGTTTQRKAIRELVKQFDVDWLKGMSFALFIPQRTDARLIAPELDKLVNGPGSQTAGMVRLITMEHLNGILAISAQPQLLEDVRRFVEVLDREGESAEKRIYVYHVQNGRAADLAKVLAGAFGITVRDVGGESTADTTDRTGGIASPFGNSPMAQSGVPMGGLAGGQTTGQTLGQNTAGGAGYQAGGTQGAKTHQQDSGQNDQTNGEPNGTTITADETNNAIVVFAAPRDWSLMEDALHRLDVLPLQVMIDAIVSEVTLNNELQFGIQWYFQSRESTAQFNNNSSGATPVPIPPTQVLPGFSYLYSGANVTATLNALRAITDIHVLSAPKLMVLNNHTASIEVGDQVPISTSSSQGTFTADSPVINSIEYQQTGVILKVTPRVNASGLVLLDISQEVSAVSNTSTASANSGTAPTPTITERKIVTSVAVEDGDTIALGGLIQNDVTKNKNVIPLLGDIPIIGHLFGSTDNTIKRTELVVLLTPRVVRTRVDADEITKELREKIRMAEPPPPPPPPPKPKPPRNGS